jgi:HEAT repeat protein
VTDSRRLVRANKGARSPATANGEFGLKLWRALALSSSALALALSLHPKAAQPVAANSMSSAHTVGTPPAPLAIDSRSLSAVNALRESGDESALEALIGIQLHAAPDVASAALRGIAQIGGRRAREYLAQRLADANASELPDLAQALAEIGGPEAHEVLRRTAQSTRIPAQDAARAALTSLDTPDARDFMLEELSRPEPAQIQTQAVAYFVDCQDPRAAAALERLIRRASVDLRRIAIDALFAQGDSAQGAIQRLLGEGGELSNSVLESPAPTAALREAQRAASIARLRAGAVTSGPVFDFLAHDLSARARQALMQAAHDPACAESAIAALASRGDSPSLSALSELADDNEAGLASRAACALLSAPDSRSHAFLLRMGTRLRADAAAALLRIDAPEGPAALARLNASREPAERLEAERLATRYGLGS